MFAVQRYVPSWSYAMRCPTPESVSMSVDGIVSDIWLRTTISSSGSSSSCASAGLELMRKSCMRIGVRVSLGLLRVGRVIGTESGTRTSIGQLPVVTSLPSRS